MMRHLKAKDFRVMPWANGRGHTVEMWREDRDGTLLWRLSRAAVVEDGPFSIFPGFDRNLTVITGPGFDLVGDVRMSARLLQPVEFAGDVPVRAEGVLAPCQDFNVMVRRGAVQAQVSVRDGGVTGGTCALFALGTVRVAGIVLSAQELMLTDEDLVFEGQAILVNIVPATFL
ncbi:MAG: HutD family protein [Pseudorhodobacter sp.]|nr:HutD family protein [Pseudorhodobacter sp.]